MSLKPALQSILLKTSAATDLKYSGRELTITGAKRAINVDRIVSIKQEKYRAEVVQVVEAGLGSYTPTASTKYTILLGDVNRVIQGGHEVLLPYSYTTPSDLTLIGANAAAQREYIHGRIIDAINANLNNYVTAASLGGGTGFTITDDAGYYPVHGQNQSNRLGATTVIAAANNDGSGFGSASVAVTTAAVYSFGVGAELLAQKPVMYNMAGNLATGVFTAPVAADGSYAVSGQNYDGFRIETLELQSAHNVTGQWALVPYETIVYVDNGTGGNIGNLAGFKAFERAFLHLMFEFYAVDPSAIVFLGDTAAVSQGLNTGLPSGTSLDENVISFGNGFSTHYFPLGTAILPALTSTNDGVRLVLDATAGEGVELSAPTWANSNKNAVVGQTAFSIYTKITVDDVSGVNPLWVGFRKQAAANTTYTSYTDYAFVGLGDNAGNIFTSTEKNSAGNTNTDTTQNWADGETHTLEVLVDVNGVVSFRVDGYAPTVTQSFTFDKDDVLIPVFGYALQATDIGTPSILEGAFVKTNDWRI